jgi:hypothetical protein
MRRLGFICSRWTVGYLRVWRPPLLILLAATIASGCADLHDRTSLQYSFAPETSRSYLYGRFSLKAGSATQPRLFVKLFNLNTGDFLTVQLASNHEEVYLIDVAPGRYQFTQLLLVPMGAIMNREIRSDNLRLPPALSSVRRPFDVEAGNAYYVGDWVGVLSRDVDFYVVYARTEMRWGMDRLTFDYDRATADMKRLYPAMETIQTWPAWRDR